MVTGLGKGRMWSYCLMGIEFLFREMIKSWDLLNNNVTIINTTELQT